MPNFFTDNKDLLFQFDRLDLKEVVDFYEDNYKQSEKFNFAPVNYEDYDPTEVPTTVQFQGGGFVSESDNLSPENLGR